MKLWPGAPSRGLHPPGRSLLAFFAVCLLATTSTIAHAQPRRPKPDPAPKGEAKDAAAPKDVGPAGAGKDAGSAKDGNKDASKDPAKGGKAKVFDFTGIDLAGRLHTPQLLYFLERANEELERAFLERRSFIPHMVRSLDEEAL
jgi:hypothetical protein